MSVTTGEKSGSRPAETVFVSYAHEDRARVEALIRVLETEGLSVWWDGLIVAGSEFASSTEQALESAAAVIVMWSRASVTSHWVRDEATRGRDRRCLIPVSLDGSEPPIGFRQYLVINLSAWQDSGDAAEIKALLKAVRSRGQQSDLLISPVSGGNATSSHVPGLAQAATAGSPLRDTAPANRGRRRWLIGAGGGLVLAGTGSWLIFQREASRSSEPTGNSIAVLPFSNLSPDPNESYFSDGLSAEVRGTLARNNELHVIAQVTSDTFRDAKLAATAIAQKLGVNYLLDGNVRKSNKTFRIGTELIDGRTGFSRWSENFDRPIDDIFAVQSEIADSVAAALMATIGGKPVSKATKPLSGGTTNVAAFDAYLQGRTAYSLSADEASDRRALAAFDAAIAADPGYAAAYAARSRTLLSIGNQYYGGKQAQALYDSAIEAAQTATSLAPDLADAQSTLGYALIGGRLDVRGARGPYELSRRLGAGDAPVLGRFALYCAHTGRAAEAEAAILPAVKLDALNALMHKALGTVLYEARRFKDSIAPIEQALVLNPQLSNAHAAIGNALLMLDRTRDAAEAFRREPADLYRLTGLAIVERKLGNRTSADQALAKMRTELGDRSLYQQAQVLAQSAAAAAAMQVLDRALALGDSGLMYARSDPLLDPLRALPAYAELLRKLGFD